MKPTKYFILTTLSALFLFVNVGFLFAQTPKFPSPTEKKLLNDLKLLTWRLPKAEKITYKLRIHKGAAFDPQDKEGTMALLGDILFPNDAIKQSFEEDFGGSLEIITTYDYIQINATSDKQELLNVLETLANAVLNPLMDKENTAFVKNALIEKVKELEKNPEYLADQIVKERLFGDFPYGRPLFGTTESLEKIDFADLIFARQRFLTADNATLLVIGDVQTNFVYKATRRYFGNWIKADETVPANFRLPENPPKGVAVKDSPINKTSELRYAFRGLARNDKDYFASEILAIILQKRLQERETNKIKVENSAHFLPGYILISSNKWNLGNIKKNGNTISLPIDIDSRINDALKEPVGKDEFEDALSQRVPPGFYDYSERWLDLDTFRLESVKDDLKKMADVSLSDVNKLAEKWKNETVAGVLIFKDNKVETGEIVEKADQN